MTQAQKLKIIAAVLVVVFALGAGYFPNYAENNNNVLSSPTQGDENSVEDLIYQSLDFSEKGQNQEALKSILKATQMIESAPNEAYPAIDKAWIYSMSAQIYYENNQAENALSHALKALDYFESLSGDNTTPIAMLYNFIGSIYEKQGKTDKALVYWEKLQTLNAQIQALASKKPSSYDQGKPLEEALKGDKLVVVKFYADWCGACSRLAPLFDAVRNQFSQDVEFVMINADEDTELSEEYNIEYFPTVFVIDPKTRKKEQISNDVVFDKAHFVQKIKEELKAMG